MSRVMIGGGRASRFSRLVYLQGTARLKQASSVLLVCSCLLTYMPAESPHFGSFYGAQFRGVFMNSSKTNSAGVGDMIWPIRLCEMYRDA